MMPRRNPAGTAAAVSGAVLVGGLSTRMGREKALLEVGGEPLVLRQLRLLATAGVEDRMVVTARGRSPGLALPPDVRVVEDLRAGAGPMAGLEAALLAANHERVVVLAVDLPGMTADWLAALITRSGDDHGVVPVSGSGPEPLAALFLRAMAPELGRRLDLGEFALRPAAAHWIASGAMRPWDPGPAGLAPLANWNHPGDWP